MRKLTTLAAVLGMTAFSAVPALADDESLAYNADDVFFDDDFFWAF